MYYHYQITFCWMYCLCSIIKIKPSFKIVSAINYMIWWSATCYSELHIQLFNSYICYEYICDFIVNTINAAFIYELLFYTPDKSHIIHHVLTILLQQYSLSSGFLMQNNWHLRLCTTAHWGLFSSIISSLRDPIRINRPHYLIKINKIYKYSYLVCKFGGISLYYIILYNHKNEVQLTLVTMIHYFLYSLVHMVQLYFCYKIIKNLRIKNN